MKKYFNVEILGEEVSIYGGIDGHYCGTKVVGHKVIDIMELKGDYTVKVHMKSRWIDADYIDINDVHVVEPITHNIGIKLPKGVDQYEIAKAIMGVDTVGDRFDEYCKVTSNLEYYGISLAEFKTLLEGIL